MEQSKLNIFLFDSLTKTTKLLDCNQKINIYVCGPTVYDHCHIGHGRMLINYDILIRLLSYLNLDFTFIQNITDIDDKILKKSVSLGISPNEVANTYIESFWKVLDLLNIKKANKYPRVTEYIQEIIDYVTVLIHNHCAYLIPEDGIYLDISKVKYWNFEKKENQHNRIEINTYKKNEADFVLIKLNKDDYTWDSPWGKFRPGWHIECSVMSECCLKEITIHGGGSDLRFPHHENEIAQYRAYHQTDKSPADIWIHNNMINSEGTKMSKSLGNFQYIHELIHNSLDADCFRYLVLTYNYKNIINIDQDKWEQSKKNVMAIRRFYFQHCQKQCHNQICEESIQFLLNDLDTASTISLLHQYISQCQIEKSLLLINILGFHMENFCQLSIIEIDCLISERNNAKMTGNYNTADQIREKLNQNFIEIKDSINSTDWYYL